MAASPKVLLLGDSIRMSYQPAVAELLGDRAEVVGPAENCQFSLYVLACIYRWLDEVGVPDIVYWNIGLHDVGHSPSRKPVQIPVEDYVGNLEFLLEIFRNRTDRVIWATSTPVHPDHHAVEGKWVWYNDQIKQYNAAAAELMTRHNVPIDDLHAVVAADPDKYICDDKIHLSSQGVEACAQSVAKAIEPHLAG